MQFLSLLKYKLSHLWQWELLQLAPLSPVDMTLVVFHSFPTSWDDKILQALHIHLLPQTCN